MDPDLTVVGDLMVDVAVETGALATGGDVHGEVRLRPAGAGANAAVWAAASGARVELFGRVGNDLSGRLLAEALRERGVAAALTVDPEARTGAMLVVREAGERSMVADRGANARVSPADLPERLAARAVLVSGYLLFDPGSAAAAVAALDRADARWVAVDAASWPLLEGFGAARFRTLTGPANVLLANERELSSLAPDSPVAGALGDLGSQYEVVCVKRGPVGTMASADGLVIESPGIDVVEADPTGSGDAFDGAFLAALARGGSMVDALSAACRAGAAAASSPEVWPSR